MRVYLKYIHTYLQLRRLFPNLIISNGKMNTKILIQGIQIDALKLLEISGQNACLEATVTADQMLDCCS